MIAHQLLILLLARLCIAVLLVRLLMVAVRGARRSTARIFRVLHGEDAIVVHGLGMLQHGPRTGEQLPARVTAQLRWLCGWRKRERDNEVSMVIVLV